MITVKTADPNPWIAYVEVKGDALSKDLKKYTRVGGLYHSIPHPQAGMPVIRVRLYGPRGGPKDVATFSKAQAKELATALLHIVEEINE
jgi:DNA-directed RNA polymerase subunit L